MVLCLPALGFLTKTYAKLEKHSLNWLLCSQFYTCAPEDAGAVAQGFNTASVSNCGYLNLLRVRNLDLLRPLLVKEIMHFHTV